MAFQDSFCPFVKGMQKASELLVDGNPDYIIAPMMGSVPFIDIMHVVNDDFDHLKVHYMPASSHLPNVNDVMHAWMKNFLNDKIKDDRAKSHFMGIDEVVSGSSAVRVYRAVTKEIQHKKNSLANTLLDRFNTADKDYFRKACNYFGELTGSKHYPFISTLISEQEKGMYDVDVTLRTRRQNELVGLVKNYFDELITYKGIGIEDAKAIETNKGRRKEYLEIRDSGNIIPIPVKAIITMDKPRLCPAVYERIENGSSNGYVKFSPRVIDFNVTNEYMTMLTNIATHVGRNPDTVAPVNMNRILNSSKYL